MKMGPCLARLALAAGSLALPLGAGAADVQVAVAANFAAPMQSIAADFARTTGYHAVLASAATGTLYAQIRGGAPFEMLLSADQKTPARLEDEGYVVAGQRFTYAIGKLVLYSATPGYVDERGAVLRSAGFRHIALANPKSAPYGTAAYQALASLGLLDALQERIVQGENIGQTYQFVASGNAELGFVALAQVAAPGKPATGSWWLVPPRLYSAIRQDAALLKTGERSPGAQALMSYLQSNEAKAVIRSYGYDLP